MEKITSLAKRRGFIFPGSEIYGGLSGTYDYGPLGVLLKENIERTWLQMFRDDHSDMYGVDAAILMNSKVWEASGHVAGFSDPLVECKKCKNRFRADHLNDFSESEYKVVEKEIGLQFNEAIKKIFYEVREIINTVEPKVEKAESLQNFLTSGSLSHEQEVVFNEVKGQLLAEAKPLIEEGKNKLTVIDALEKTLQQSQKYIGYVTQQYLNRFIACPNCNAVNQWNVPRQFNMMFKTNAGAAEDESSVVYLRPETAGGIFTNFKNVIDSMHPKLPFGIAQIGKAFRNEIAPRDFIFRLRELSQMEVEYFVKEAAWEEAFEKWRAVMHRFANAIGIPAALLHELEVSAEDRAHYSKRTIDFEFDYPFGRGELWGLAYRGDFDLSAHEKGSSTTLSYLDEEAKERFIPHVIEPSLGVDRTVLAVLASAYREDDMNGEVRSYLALAPRIAPIKAVVSPLLKNKPELVAKAREVFKTLKKIVPQVAWDDNGNIGKRYRRQDEIGTPWCITVDFDTLGENADLKDTVTLRFRDSGAQERLSIEQAIEKVRGSLASEPEVLE